MSASMAVPRSAPQPALGWEPRVLVVDDDDICRFRAQSLLERIGLNVDAATDGEQAVAMAAAWPYVAVFTDCAMPDLDGFGTARQVRGEGRSAGALIVAVTVHARSVCLASGMDHHLAKPLDAERLQHDCRLLGLIARRATPRDLEHEDRFLISAPDHVPTAGIAPDRAVWSARNALARCAALMPELWRAVNRTDTGTVGRVADEIARTAVRAGLLRVGATAALIRDSAAAGRGSEAAAGEPHLRETLGDAQAALDGAAPVRPPVVRSEPVRVACADDDPLARQAIASLLRGDERIELVGMADGVEAIVSLTAEAAPEVVLVDWLMPDGGGAAATRRIRTRDPAVRVIALTASDSPEAYLEMLRAGVSGRLVKGADAARMRDTIARVLARAAEPLQPE